ncbi:hypothetical protein Pisl_0292 [Pyrobaculum islandicum DSM 4184]|uniref:Uncharacterized protein n=1 Tax=Pyrobaculum islandicum (strain DSM 4184 / JCM 9189 / GEO3) TaxID=384616 RepID=A1RR89_PYRIL|nr:hypothetical protein [Pyrobaculum islandicum]ABL87471.1 hypothetical protein Pisl_0292 [Pyrobaculum islandicum DSM 4184]
MEKIIIVPPFAQPAFPGGSGLAPPQSRRNPPLPRDCDIRGAAAVLAIVATIAESRLEGLCVHLDKADVTTAAAVLLYAKITGTGKVEIRAKPPHVQELYGLIYAPTVSYLKPQPPFFNAHHVFRQPRTPLSTTSAHLPHSDAVRQVCRGS